MFSPNSPSSFIVSTSAWGYSPRCSMSDATGTTSRSTNSRMVFTTSRWSSARSATDHSALRPAGDGVRVEGQLLQDGPGVLAKRRHRAHHGLHTFHPHRRHEGAHR